MGVQPRFVLGILAQLLLGGCVLAGNRDSGLVYQREPGSSGFPRGVRPALPDGAAGRSI